MSATSNSPFPQLGLIDARSPVFPFGSSASIANYPIRGLSEKILNNESDCFELKDAQIDAYLPVIKIH